MAKPAVVSAVAERLAANWTECALVGANLQGEVPQDGTPFILVQYPVANEYRTTHSPTYREEGAIRLMINVSTGSGTDQALAWGDQLGDLFRYKKFDGVECKSPTSPLIHDENDDGLYFRTSVVVPYHYTFYGDGP